MNSDSEDDLQGRQNFSPPIRSNERAYNSHEGGSATGASYQPAPVQTPVLRQPVGFQWNAGNNATYAPPTPVPATPLYLPGQAPPTEPRPKKKSKNKEKDPRDLPREKASSRKAKESYKASEPYPPPEGYNAPRAGSSRHPPTFRVDSYVNEPPPAPQAPPPNHGGHHHQYRDDNPSQPRKRRKHQLEPELRMDPGPSSFQHRPQPDQYRQSVAQSPADNPSPYQDSGVRYETPARYSPGVEPQPVEKPHRPRKHRSERRRDDPQPQVQAFPQGHTEPIPQPMPLSQPSRPPPVLRILTLLIEDARPGQAANQLTEVRVPLRSIGAPEDGFWADAKEVGEELQSGPARIDGPARVYVMRGKYRQYWLRVSAEGKDTCNTANLRVTPERTLEVFVEYIPVQPFQSAHSTPSRHGRAMLTPITDTMATPSPAPIVAPQPTIPHKFSPIPSDSGYEARPQSTVPLKRPRSTSAYSSVSDNFRASQSHHPQRADEEMSQHSSSYPTRSIQPEESISQRSSSGPQQSISHGSRQSASFRESPAFRASPVVRQSSIAHDSPQRRMSPVSQHSRSDTQHSQAPHQEQSLFTPNEDMNYSEPQPPAAKQARYNNSSADSPSSAVNTPAQWSSVNLSSNSVPRIASPPAAQRGGFQAFSSQPTPFCPAGFATFSNPNSQASLTSSSAAQSSASPFSSQPPPSELDNKVGSYIRSQICKQPGWDAFVKSRSRNLTIRELLEQYRYVQNVFDTFISTTTPEDLEGATNITITKAMAIRAFNQTIAWGDDCTDTLHLISLYGPEGTRLQDPRINQMLDEQPAISTGIQARECLKILRGIDERWAIEHPEES